MDRFVVQKLNPATREWNDIFATAVEADALTEWKRIVATFPDWPVQLVRVLEFRVTLS